MAVILSAGSRYDGGHCGCVRVGEDVVKGDPGGLAPWNDNKPFIQQTIHSTKYSPDCNRAVPEINEFV